MRPTPLTPETQVLPSPPKTVIRALHIFITVLMLIGVGGALAIKLIADTMRDDAPEFAYLYWPLLLLSLATIVCYETFLACLWLLVARVKAEQIFDSHSLTSVKCLRYSCWIGALLCFTMLFFIPGPPTLAAVVAAGMILLITIGLTISVLTHLLIQATAYRSELNEVI